MYSQLFVFFSLLLLLFVSACEGQRLAIDRNSCGDDVYDHLKTGIETAIRWAKEAAEKIWSESGEANPRIVEKVGWLLGDDISLIDHAAVGFAKLGMIKVVDEDVKGDAWKISQSVNDIAFFCNMDFVEKVSLPEFEDYPFKDTIRDQWVRKDNWMLNLKHGGEKSVEMVTWLPEQWKSPDEMDDMSRKCDIIIANPRYLKSEKKKGWPTLTGERVQKAVNPSFGKLVTQAVGNFGQEFVKGPLNQDKQPKAYINLIETNAQVALHELTHTRQGQGSDDVPHNKCYGWVNAVECRNPLNADNLAWLAVAIQLIEHFNYDVTKEGKLIRIE